MGARILLADDLSFVRMMQKDLLEKEGYEIVGEAADGITAVQKYKELRPDIIILDITMPYMNGLEAMKKIFEFDPNAKIIICSALGQQLLIIEAIKAGVKDFIVKPYKNERMLSAIKKALSS
ncbi:MAG: response regulator [Spirochaetes bacterium]|jgi:two-component system chemotaxis response regulator CheY|nr:response regulator [Spirochaetota bacterium]